MTTKIIIADDHPIFRAGIKDIIGSMPGMELVGEAKDGLEAYQLIVSKVPDIAILDLEMPQLTGLDVCRKVLGEKHFTRFIILTMHKESHFFREAMDAGVLGYLLKDNAIDELVTCIKEVSGGRTCVSRQIENYLTEHQAREQLPAEITKLYAGLTATEKVILKLVSQSKTSQEIAESIFISPNTVDNHRANIARKLQLEGKNSLLKFALQYKDLL